MARKLFMSWIGSQKRWMKMYRGHRYAISCKALGVPATKEASWQAANRWWEAKQAELDRQHEAEAVKPGTPQAILRLLQAWKGAPLDDEADAGLTMLEFLQEFKDKPLPPEVTEAVLGVGALRRIQEGVDALLDGPEEVEVSRTVGGQVDRWVTLQQSLAQAGRITPDRADNNRICLYHFRDFLGKQSSLEVIDARRLQDYFLHCLGGVSERNKDREKKAGWSVDYATKVFGVARQFVRFLWESDLIDLPKNIDSKAFRFGKGAKAIQTWTVEEFRTQVSAATGQLRLHLLLMANCGMLQTDIAELRQGEVDWAEGRIIRKRSKTGDEEEVPTVNYKLWPLTFELLKQYRSKDAEFVLLTESGRRWVDKRLVEGKLVKADNIASCYAWLKKRMGFRKPLKLIRKTSASLIESHKEYGRYKSHFLGHSPRSVADRHYAAPSQPLFDEVVAWLGREYGYLPPPPPAKVAKQRP
jgi:integrase